MGWDVKVDSGFFYFIFLEIKRLVFKGFYVFSFRKIYDIFFLKKIFLNLLDLVYRMVSFRVGRILVVSW